MSVVFQVGQLIAPLGDDSEGVFDERADDQEAAEGWDVSRPPN